MSYSWGDQKHEEVSERNDTEISGICMVRGTKQSNPVDQIKGSGSKFNHPKKAEVYKDRNIVNMATKVTTNNRILQINIYCLNLFRSFGKMCSCVCVCEWGVRDGDSERDREGEKKKERENAMTQ